MNPLTSALFVALFVQLAVGAPTTSTTKTPTSDTVMMGQGVSFGDMDQIIIVMGESPCMASCMPAMRNETVRNATEIDVDDDAKFKEICDTYFAAADCLKKCPDGNDHLLKVLLSGAHYLCVEQRTAFKRAMPCIRKQKEALQKECCDKCAVRVFGSTETMHALANATLIQTPETNTSIPFPLFGELCDLLHCAIPCGRDLLNDRCEHDLHAGKLMTEMTIRPLEENAKYVKKMSAKTKKVVTEALPNSCGFLIDAHELNKLRHESWKEIDSKSAHTPKPSHFAHFPKTSSKTTRKQNVVE